MMSRSTATEYARGMLEKGELPDVASANVQIIRMMGVMLITMKLPREVRTAYNAAVKTGVLGRLPKEGLLPEAYFHPNAKPEAIAQRQRAERETIEASRRVLATLEQVHQHEGFPTA